MVNACQFDTIFNVYTLPLLNNSRYPMLCTYYVFMTSPDVSLASTRESRLVDKLQLAAASLSRTLDYQPQPRPTAKAVNGDRSSRHGAKC
jgi:hypothetical protein